MNPTELITPAMPWEAAVWIGVAILLSIFLGAAFWGKGQLAKREVAGIVCLIDVVVWWTMQAFGKITSDAADNMVYCAHAYLFGAIMLELWNARRGITAPVPPVREVAPSPTLRPVQPPNPGEPLPERNSGGFIRLPTFMVLLACAALAFGILTICTGCATLEKLGGKETLSAVREGLGEAVDTAESLGMDTGKIGKFRPALGDKSVAAPAAPAGELISEGYVDFSGQPLDNGVVFDRVYRDRKVISQPRPRDIVSPAPKKSADPANLPGRTEAGEATSLPPPTQVRDSATTGALTPATVVGTGGTSFPIAHSPSPISTVTTARLVQVEARITAIESPLAADLSNATAVVELVLADGKVSGHVVALANTSLADRVKLSRLHFADVPATVNAQGLTVAASPADAEIQYEAALDADGNLSVTAVPAAGSPSALFFQRVELTGRPLLNQYGVVITNAPMEPGRPAPSTDEVLRSVRWAPFPRVAFDAPAIESRADDGSSKKIIGQLFLNGRKVEWIAKGRQWSTIHNALEPLTDEGKPNRYFQPLKSGDVVTISIADLDGRNESNRKELVVP